MGWGCGLTSRIPASELFSGFVDRDCDRGSPLHRVGTPVARSQRYVATVLLLCRSLFLVILWVGTCFVSTIMGGQMDEVLLLEYGCLLLRDRFRQKYRILGAFAVHTMVSRALGVAVL